MSDEEEYEEEYDIDDPLFVTVDNPLGDAFRFLAKGLVIAVVTTLIYVGYQSRHETFRIAKDLVERFHPKPEQPIPEHSPLGYPYTEPTPTVGETPILWPPSGFASVESLSDRNRIPSFRRLEGTMVYVREDQKLYKLAADLVTWVDIEIHR